MRKILFIFLFLPLAGYAQFVETVQYVTVSFTRPSNATVYAANEAVSQSTPALLIFTIGRESGIGGRIISAMLLADTVNVTNGTFDLLLFEDNTGVTAGADTTAYALTNARAIKLFNKIAFTLATYGAGSTDAYAITNGIILPFQPASGSKNIYGQLIATGAYQPKSAGVIKVKLGYIQE